MYRGLALEICLHHEERNAARAPMRGLALPFLIALMLHGFVLFSFGANTRQGEIKPPPLTVRLMAASEHPVRQSKRLSQPAAANKGLSSDSSEASLDMNLIRDQARAYASESYTGSGPAVSIEGDYYGSYSGGDSGVFFFHLGRNGQGSGTGESNSFGIPFLISGKVDAQGKLQMLGNGIAGEARFNGQLDLHSGEVTGTWNVPGMMHGSFSGRRENQRTALNNH